MTQKCLWLWDATNSVWVKAQCDANGCLKIDTSELVISPYRCHAYLGTAIQPNIINLQISRVELNATIYNVGSMFQTGEWAKGVGDAGSNATTIIDADPTTGSGFVASMRYALVSWIGAHTGTGYVVSVDSSTQITIVKNSGTDFAAGDTYTINKAHILIPEDGYYFISNHANFEGVVANKRYFAYVTKNGVAITTSSSWSAGTANTGTAGVPMKLELAANDIIALAGQTDAGVDTVDIGNSDETGRVSFIQVTFEEST